MNHQRSLFKRITTRLRPRSVRRSEEIASIRTELRRRGVRVDQLTDPEIEAAISDGRRVLGSASVRGSDVTGAFVVLVRHQEKL